MPERDARMRDWLYRECGLNAPELEPASGDASFRRYFRLRLTDGTTRILMDAPPERERCEPFVAVARALAAAGVRAPRVLRADLAQGFLLLEDLGERLYLNELDPVNVERLYGDALSTLLTMQACVPADGLPPYDHALLLREMRLFPEWLLERHLSLELEANERALLETVFARLAQSALAQPRVFVHRDYHSRNLLHTDPPTPGVLDFQDAVQGPVTYDLVSLLRDCYIRWPAERVDDWAWGYFELACQSGVLRAEHERDYLAWFDLMGVQRHLKAAGIFARLWHRDGKDGYLADIPRTLGYVTEVAMRRPGLEPFADFIARRVLPALPPSADRAR